MKNSSILFPMVQQLDILKLELHRWLLPGLVSQNLRGEFSDRVSTSRSHGLFVVDIVRKRSQWIDLSKLHENVFVLTTKVVYVSRPISQIMIPSVLLILMGISKRHLWFLYVAGSRVKGWLKREHALHKSHSCASKCPLPLSIFE